MIENLPKILIVDDDPQLVELFAAKMEMSGFAVRKAFNGKEGFDIAKKEKPDLILLDLKMPVLDGAETLAKLHNDPDTKDIKVVILSSFNDWSAVKIDQRSAQALGAVDFFPKGTDLDEIVARLKPLLGMGQ